MNRAIFNSIIIIVWALAIVTISIILPHEYKRSVKKCYTLIQALAIVMAVVLFTFMLLSLDYTGTPCLTGNIVKIDVLSSFAGIYDRYVIVLVDADGTTHEIQSLFPIYSGPAEELKYLKPGDYCEVYGSTIIDAFFYAIH